MAEVLADPSLYDHTGGTPPTRQELEQQYAAQVRGGPADGSARWLNLLVLLGRERRPIGFVQATLPAGDDVAEIAWVIGRPWQRQGFGARAAHLLVAEVAGLGARRLLAHIHPAHPASQRIAAALGLQPTDIVVDGEVRWAGAVISGVASAPGAG